ncbi:Trafficking protein particle complex subunit 9 [Halocaridina rubra]|uniref:Trafficking protein particle complex subunit 9 n=1 Tax=Halocaridina rubra TaxID=373956 RepID=A0AAN9A6M1_HALRR
MRSSVSVILSNPPPDTTMSYPDYATNPHRHQTLLVLVKQVGTQLKSRSFHKLYERISRVGHVKVSDSNGSQRPVWVTYRREYPVENNDWGDFQTHRRVLGIITIGQVGSQSDLNDICKQHESLKVKYSSTLYDSRCIILGLNPDGTIYEADSRGPSRGTSPEPNGALQDLSHPVTLNGHTHPTHIKKVSAGSTDRDSGVYETVSSEEKTTDCDNHSDSPQGLTEGINDLKIDTNNHITNGSDSGSESTSEVGCCEDGKMDSPRDLAPDSAADSAHDTSQSSISTSASHSSRLSLQPPSIFKTRALFYPTGDHAVNIETQLQEFISSLFWVLESKRLDKSQEKLERPPLLCAPFERKDFIGLDMDSRTNKKRCAGRLRKQLADLTLQAGLPSEAISHYSHAADTLKNCNDWLWLAACFEGLCAASVVMLYPNLMKSSGLQRFSSLGVGQGNSVGNRSRNNSINTNSLPTGLEPSVAKQTSKNCFTPEEIVDKYREAIVHYSKYRNAGVVETEASIKAVHVLIELRRYLMAAEFLSNVVFINLQLSDEEKIARFSALSDLYHQIGFHRKASFFRRVAAMRCVAPQNQQPDWGQCYRLLLQTLEGYKICLDPLEFRKDGSQGWPSLQIQILQELVGTSRRMGQNALCTRHQAFLVSAMLPHMTDAEKQEMASMLESLSGRSGSGSTPLVVQDTGIIIPPVNFLNLPTCRGVRVLAPDIGRKAEKITPSVDGDSGPFIFSPFTSLTSSSNKTQGKIDFDWVEGDVCEIVLDLENSMPFDLKITSMMLMTEGIQFESWTSTVVLKPERGAQAITLRGRPQGAGELRVIGYSSTVLGVTSNCRYKFMPQLKIPMYTINVVPALPFLQILTGNGNPGNLGGDKTAGDESRNLRMSLSAGETNEYSVVLHNVSSQPVEDIDIGLTSKLDKETLNQVFQYSEENIQAQLPIPPGGKASLTLYVYAAADFLCPGRLMDETFETGSMVSGSEPPSLLSTGPSSLPSRQSAATSSTRGARTRRTDSSASLLSSRSGSSAKSGSSSSTQAPSSSFKTRTTVNTPACTGRTLEAVLQIKYSGGLGRVAEYCRTTQLTISVDVTPSLLVTRWDVLPAELPHQCYVVLDLLNCATQEMDLHYTPTKHILIEAGDSCRVPVPVDRCPLAILSQGDKEGESGVSWSSVLGNHVASLVELRWTQGPNDTPGRASLTGITFPPPTHDLITMAPIHWDVQVNGEDVVGGTENSGVVGQTMELTVGVSNTSGAPLPPLSLRLTAFQDHQNGHFNYRLDAKMIFTGAPKLTTPQLAEGEEFHHKCGLVFFTSGVYKVEVTCSPAAAVAQTSFYENITPAHQHAWKFAPPLEITITDV